MPLWFRHIVASLKLSKAQLHPFACFPSTDMRHGDVTEWKFRPSSQHYRTSLTTLYYSLPPHVATSGKSKISPHSKSQEHLCSRKGLRHGTVQLAGIRDRNCSTKGARKLIRSRTSCHSRREGDSRPLNFKPRRGEPC